MSLDILMGKEEDSKKKIIVSWCKMTGETTTQDEVSTRLPMV